MNCDSCNYFFIDNDSFNIHLKNCKNNINNDPKNKYYCPSCDKKFRILTNLEKHNESKKHLNLFEWNKKQLNINNNNINTKIINLISDIPEKEEEQKQNQQQSSLEQLIRNRELELQSYKIPTKPTQPYDTPMQQIQSHNTYESNQSHNTQMHSHTHLQNKLEEDDIDLSEEIKQTKLSLNLSIDSHQKEIEKVENQLNDDNFLDNIQEQRTIIQKQIEQSEEPLPTPKTTQPTPKIVQTPPKLVQEPTKIDQKLSQPQSQKSIPKCPIEFKSTLIWKKMSSLINNTKKEDETKLANTIITSLTKSPLNAYPYICAFIMCSEDLDNKPELRTKLINGLIEIKKAFAKLVSIKQLYWNGVNTNDGYALMNKLNLQEIKA